MLLPSLRREIHYFVSEFWLVREQQVLDFFSDCGRSDVEYCLVDMKARNEVFVQPGGHLSAIRHLPHPLANYMPRVMAIDVMLQLKSQKVLSFSSQPYPLEYAFLTSDNIVYDVTVFDDAWISKYSLIPGARARGIPPGESDATQHIALVTDKAILGKVSTLGFSLYAMPDENGKIELYE